MARTDKLRQSQLELQAGQSGESAKQRAHESLTNSRQRNADRAQQSRQFDDSIEQRNLDRYQRQWEQSRKERAERDKIRADNQAQKPRTTNFGSDGYLAGRERRPSGDARLDENARQFDERQAQQQGQFDKSQAQQQGQFDTSTDLQAASRGLQRGGASPADNPRLQALQMEMQKREKEQMGAGVEQTGRRGFVPTLEAQQASEENANLNRQKAATEAYRAITSRRRLGFEMQKAQAQYDATGSKEAKVEVKAAMERAQGPLSDFNGLLDRLENSVDSTKISGGLRQNDWEKIAEMFGQMPPAGNAAEVKQAIDTKQVNPRLMSWLSERQAKMVVDFVAEGTGDLPESKYIDFMSSGMKMFMDQVQLAKQQFGIEYGGPGGLMATRTRARQARMAQKLAAKAILTGDLMDEGGDMENGGGEQQLPDQALGRTQEQQQNKDASRQPTNSRTEPGEPGYITPPSAGDNQPSWGDVR